MSIYYLFMDNFVADAIYIDATPERVFDALLLADDLSEWMDAQVALGAPEVGGAFKVERRNGVVASGRITVYEPWERLEISDYYHESADGRRGPMRVCFTLEPRDDGVWITVRQDNLDSQPEWKEFAQATRRGWVRDMVALKRHIEGI